MVSVSLQSNAMTPEPAAFQTSLANGERPSAQFLYGWFGGRRRADVLPILTPRVSLPIPLALERRLSYNQPMNAIRAAHAAPGPARLHTPLHRFVLAWAVRIGGLVGFWCCRQWLGTRAFNYGQGIVLLATWKIASLLCLPPQAWARFTPLMRMLAYWLWIGTQPRQFLAGQRTTAGAPIPTISGFVVNAVTGAVLLWIVPRALPVWSPWPIRFWIALVGFTFLFLIARLDFWGTHIPRDGLRRRKALGLSDCCDNARRFLGPAVEPPCPGFLAGGDFPPSCAPRRRQGRTIGRVSL
jgi:hypothetical protein